MTAITSPVGLALDETTGIARVTLNRPERRNALSEEVIGTLDAAIRSISSDSAIRVVILAAEGPVFCAGHDLSEMVGRTEAEYSDLFAACSRLMQRLRSLPQPVIARVQGPAVAAGCQLVAACDLAVVSETATFSTPGVSIGLFCATPMVPLVRAIPAKAALEMLLTGRSISAGRACELGLVNRVVPAEQLDAAVGDLAGAICAFSPVTIGLGKAAFYDGLNRGEPDAYDRATAVMVENALKHDAQEGITAFLEKRKPQWSGE